MEKRTPEMMNGMEMKNLPEIGGITGRELARV
jgi:hypothetical protein